MMRVEACSRTSSQDQRDSRMLNGILKRLKIRKDKAPDWRRKVNVLETSIDFIISNNIAGDYLEFGVYRGQSFAHAYKYFRRRIRRYLAGRAKELSDYRRQVEKMRFIAFDSF